jgi:hypothetical protein
MNHLIFWGIAVGFSIMMLTGGSLAAERPAIVNLLVDFNVPASTNNDFFSIYNLALKNNASWTLILTEDNAKINRNTLGVLSPTKSMELAISGNHSDEKMSTESYAEQKAILEQSKKWVELCKICGVNEINVKGFMPQLYDQNEDTYKALDDLGIIYNAGFKAGIAYAPGHEKDVWPYKVEGHEFYAVPISTYALSGEKVPLDDREIKEKGLSSSQWYDILKGKFDEVSGSDEPMVISLHTSISGNGEYLDALKQFFSYAISGNAAFVTTSDLVNMSITGVHDAIPASSQVSSVVTAVESIQKTNSGATESGCVECDALKNNTNITSDVIKI